MNTVLLLVLLPLLSFIVGSCCCCCWPVFGRSSDRPLFGCPPRYWCGVGVGVAVVVGGAWCGACDFFDSEVGAVGGVEGFCV